MTNSELIHALKTQDMPTAQAYDLLIEGIFEDVPVEQVAAGQQLVTFFRAKIEGVLLVAIRELRAKP